MVSYRDYQLEIIDQGLSVLKKTKLLYLAMEVRTGKTLTSLGICEQLGVENVLFITKKKAISSITDDYDKMCPVNFSLFTTNYESLHKIPKIKWHAIIADESHSMGAFPKPSKRSKAVKELIQMNDPYFILLSGTPTPESYSQMYHQVWGHKSNPFLSHKNFYHFAKTYVNVIQKKINGFNLNDYSRGSSNIIEKMKPFTISYSQKEAGFKSTIKENILFVPMNQQTYNISSILKKDLVYENEGEFILGDTAVKLMTKLHQLYSGTIKYESGNSEVLDTSKAKFIKEKFKGKKIGIFYKFKEELNALKEVFGKDDLTVDLKEFDESEKHIALQIVSGREGISLRNADYIVYYNIDFSATSYWQSRDRMTTKNRLHNEVYWIFSEKGIEGRIYKAVSNKKDYTLKHFKRDYVI